MRIAAEAAGVSIAELAAELGVSRYTVSNYLAGRTRPRRSDYLTWSIRTGVPLSWLLTGQEPRDNGGAAVTIGYLTPRWAAA